MIRDIKIIKDMLRLTSKYEKLKLGLDSKDCDILVNYIDRLQSTINKTNTMINEYIATNCEPCCNLGDLIAIQMIIEEVEDDIINNL